MKPSIAVIVLAVLGGGLYLLYATTEASSPPAVSDEPGARAASRAAGGPAPLATAPPAPLPPAVAVDDDRAGPAGVPAEEPEPGAPATAEEVRDHIQASFVAAPAASPSVGDLARRLESGMRAALPIGSSVRSVECRGSLCRVETAHPGVDEFRDFVQRAFQDLSRVSNGPAFVTLLEEPAPGRPVVAVAYVGREGTTLPVPGHVAAR
jgi:hypothetical protein